MTPGVTYTVTLENGIRALEGGRQVINTYEFSFEVLPPRIAYLAPSDQTPQNIALLDLRDRSVQPITDSPTGVYDYAASPDGERVAFTEVNPLTGASDIKIVSLVDGGLRQITNCVDASCTSPVWRPDGRVIAYERSEFNSALQGVGGSPPRIWLVDLLTNPPTSRPLFSETQILGYNAQWSADGRRIALVDRAAGAILVYDFDSDRILAVPSSAGTSGALSPDGTRLVFPELFFVDGATAHMQLVDLDSGDRLELSSPGDGVDDKRAIWHPSGDYLVIARDDLAIAPTTQLYRVDPLTGASEPLTTDPRFTNAYFWFDPNGTALLIQRFPQFDEAMQPDPLARPQVWTLDIASGDMTLLAENAFLPTWVP